MEWASDYQEDRITILYDSMSNNTRMMADAIAQGIHEVDSQVAVKVFNVSRHDKNEILANVFRSKAVLVGSSTMNNVMMPKIAGMLEEITGLRFKNKKAGAFGSYGWNGGAVDRIHARLTDAGFETVEGLKAKWKPDCKAIAECRAHGRKVARKWASRDLAQEVVRPVIDNNRTESLSEKSCCDKKQAAPQTTGVLDRMLCTVCQWIYDPEQGEENQGVAPGTPWSEVPDYFLCPECGLGKDVFELVSGERLACL